MKRTEISRRPSAKKQAFDAEYAKVLPGVLKRGCEFTTYANPGMIPDWAGPGWRVCDGRRVGHHAIGRRARDANDHVICLCKKHHDLVHDHPEWSRHVGLMLSRTSPPARG